ncbi:putative amidoligase enzyme-domain-containing protein [Hypoxylon sp. NC0597]|nr:putative amidoligase enzyme-domain-containing protein [Hypoxylon sp. NC0597]
MASGQNTRDMKLSFGVEMEFYIYFSMVEKDLVSVPKGFESHPGGPFHLDPDKWVLEDELTSMINKLVQDLPGETVLPPDETDVVDLMDDDSLHLRNYRLWDVYPDISLDVLPDELQAETNDYSGWLGIELISPALWATDEGFNQVRTVCEFISRKFWIITHESAGLHIHVGNGKKYFPIESLRQISAFLFAADPILAQSHPEHRHKNSYCYSLREHAPVSLKKIRSTAPVSEQFNEPTSSRSSRFRTFFRNLLRSSPPRPNPTRNINERERYNFPPRPQEGVFTPHSQRDPPEDWRPRMLQAVAVLLEQTDPEKLYGLMASFQRFAYQISFPDVGRKRTVEFRRPASSVDPAEVVAQARIAVSLCKFAANPDEDQFKKIILDCDTADENPTWFDVYDLLIELDLLPEARVIYAALTGTITDSVRAEYWSSR